MSQSRFVHRFSWLTLVLGLSFFFPILPNQIPRFFLFLFFIFRILGFKVLTLITTFSLRIGLIKPFGSSIVWFPVHGTCTTFVFEVGWIVCSANRYLQTSYRSLTAHSSVLKVSFLYGFLSVYHIPGYSLHSFLLPIDSIW